MATAGFSMFAYLCFILLLSSHGSPSGASRDCNFDTLQALEPLEEVRSEAGTTQRFDDANEQLLCARVSVTINTIEPQGLFVPQFNSPPKLALVIQGNGVAELTFQGSAPTGNGVAELTFQGSAPTGNDVAELTFQGSPETYRLLMEGDVIPIPYGVQALFYNNGTTTSLVVMFVSLANISQFVSLANISQSVQMVTRAGISPNIFSGFGVDLLSDAFGINATLAASIQNTDDERGVIVRVGDGFTLQNVSPDEKAECMAETTTNFEDPTRVDIDDQSAGRVTRLDGRNLPILQHLGLSAERGTLYQNATLPPFWVVNAYTVAYVIQGSVRLQVVDNNGRAVFDGVLRQGQLLVIPQNFPVLLKAGQDGCQYIAIKTDANPITSKLAGKGSILRALPVDVIAVAYRITEEEAILLKNSGGDD